MSPLFRLVEQHIEELLRVWPTRFARQHGPLRPVEKRQLLWAEWLQKEVLEPVPHRHLVLTMPRLLRGIFRKRRELLLDLAQCAAEALAATRRDPALPSALTLPRPVVERAG